MAIRYASYGFKYYLCTGKRAYAEANKYRQFHNGKVSALQEVAASIGATNFRYHPEMLLLTHVKLPDDKLTKSWTKPKGGYSRPKKRRGNEPLLKHFTPSGWYTVEANDGLKEFWDWLGCPDSFDYTEGGCDCWSSLGSAGVYWFSADGPLLVRTPDIAAAKAYADMRDYQVTNGKLDWKPPRGLKEILKEEWDLLRAKHEAKRKEVVK
jgi:hypothetical protein